MRVFECHEQRVVVKPGRFALAERLEVATGRYEQALSGPMQHGEALAVQGAVVHALGVVAPETMRVVVVVEQPLLGEVVQVDKVGVASKRREALVWRVPKARGHDRKHLPDGDPGGGKKVHEAPRLGTQRSHAPRRGKRRHRHQDS